MYTPQQFGTPISVTSATAANSHVIATKSGVAATAYYITDIQASSDLAGGIVQVKNGSTVIWQGLTSANGNLDHSFVSPLRCSVAADAVVDVTVTSGGAANLSGFSLP